jgi:hypothetical protein
MPPSAFPSALSSQVLHLVVRKLAELPPPDPLLWSFLHVDELLVDIGDDLTDYEVLCACAHTQGLIIKWQAVSRIGMWKGGLAAGVPCIAVQDDVEANSFNILRCYVHLYGRDAPRHLVRHCVTALLLLVALQQLLLRGSWARASMWGRRMLSVRTRPYDVLR